METLTLACLAVLPVIAILAALRDLTTMTIPNWMSLVLLAAFVPAAFLAGLGWQDMLLHLAVGVAALLAGMGLFAFRVLGGGDAKLLAVLCLWMGPQSVLTFILWTALVGGLFSLGLLMARQHLAPLAHAGPVWTARLLEPKGDIPYGVAIAAGALLAWPGAAMMSGAF